MGQQKTRASVELTRASGLTESCCTALEAAVRVLGLVRAVLCLGLRFFRGRCASVRVVDSTVREGTARHAHEQSKRKH
jgi:hypothetical protein